MPRITPVHWKTLVCIFEKDGFIFERSKGSHMVFSRKGTMRPIVIPKYKNIDDDIIINLMKTAKMNRSKYFRLLAKCK